MDEYEQQIETDVESYFQNVAFQSLNNTDPSDSERFGNDVSRMIQELSVGNGSNVFRANQSGIWLGGDSFEDATFSVSMGGNVSIQVNANDINEISFLSGATLYGVLQVADVAGVGFLNLGIVDGSNNIIVGLQINTGIGASGFNEVTLEALGGSFDSQGNASNHYLTMNGAQGGIFQILSEMGSTNEKAYSDLDFDHDGLVLLAEITSAVAAARPFFRNGAIWYDSGTGLFKGRIAGATKTFTLT
jgi:hypothetical protein